MSDIIINNSPADDGVTVINPVASLSEINQAKTDTLNYKNQASTSASNAATSETNAATSETNAAASALSASSSADIATSALGSVGTSETNASNYANNAQASATAASNSASSSSASATTASNHATTAGTYKDTAVAQAGIATTKANEASISASEALASRNEAQVDRIAVGEMLNEFKTIYWGSRTSDPDSLEVTDGDLYYNSNTDTLMLRVAGLWGVAVPSVSNIYTKPEIDVLLSEKQDAADFTNANIKIMYEANLDTNAFTDDEKTKLGLIEDGATADMSALEIKTSYESNTNTNAFTDAYKAQLDDSYTSTELDAGQLDNRYYTETEVLDIVGNLSPLYNAYGYTKALTVEERFLETNTPNVLTDNSDDKARFSDGIYDISDRDITLPVAPFAPTSTDELLDDKVNGLTCQMAHSKGDVVVTGNELVTNGTFDTDTTGWIGGNGGVISYDSGKALLTVSATYGSLSQQIDVVSGATYIFNFDVTFGTANNSYIRLGSSSGNSSNYYIGSSSSTEGTRTLTWTSNVTGTIWLNLLTYAGTINFDNISVKLKDNIYQATVDTASGALLSDTTKFQVLPQVTRQDVITLRKHKTTKAVDYHTFKGTTYFGEGYSQKDVMSHYGYSQVDKNLWEDATYEYVFVELKNSLNAGAFHPVYNALGTNGWAKQGGGNIVDNGVYWYGDTNTNSYFDTYRAFIDYEYGDTILDGENGNYTWGYISRPSGRPDSKLYDKVYLNGYGGLIPSSKYLAYAGKEMPRLLDSESNDLLSESWLEEGVEILEVTQVAGNNSSTAYIAIDDSNPKPTVGSSIIHQNTVARIIRSYYSSGDDGSWVMQLDRPIDRDAGVSVIYTAKQPHLLTYKSSTTTDIIGNPSNYPTDWLSHLASGKSIVGNALLVGQDGVDYTSVPPYQNIVSGKKVTDKLSLLFDEDTSDGISFSVGSGITAYTSFDYVSNKFGGSYSSNTNRLAIWSYTSSNQSALQSDPQKVLQVQPKAIASNSHSIYKGAMMTYAGTGKVAVGNGSNGLESRVLENCEALDYDYTTNDNIRTTGLKAGDKVLILKKTGGESIGDIYIANDGMSDYAIDSYPYWAGGGFVLYNTSAPTHNTISLDNSNSPATKWFITLAEMEDGELAVQTFSEEMIWDYDADVDNIVVLDGTSSYKPTTAGVIYRVVGGNLAGHIVVTNGATFDMTVLSIENGQVYYNNTIETRMSVWDGNGFGDNNKFNQLTNGTSTDLNNNTIQTKVLTKRLGIYKGDI